MVLVCEYGEFCNSVGICKKAVFLGFLVTLFSIKSCGALGSFGFDIHHRYSEAVRGIFDYDSLPEKGSPEYYSAMAQRDRLVRGRHLAATTPAPVTFADGNDTVRINGLGYLYYANVSVGTPALWFLVALDTGSDLFWLPCDCSSCVGSLVTRSGQQIDLNVYYPNASSTAKEVSCNNPTCGAQWSCSTRRNACAYQINYLSSNTSSTGILVDDVLHLAREDSDQEVDASITLGCGVIQTGGFLNGAAPNGLFGLGMDGISVPSTLASQGFASNSFSMCFGQDGIGRIVFGDKGGSHQGQTPFNIYQPHLTYNISLTQVAVGKNITSLSDTAAIFDSGTSFTYLNDPAYSTVVENFNTGVQQPRHPADPQIPFEYCYDMSATETTIQAPSMNLTMKGGSQFFVNMPFEIFPTKGGGYVYCLGLLKSDDINIIGQNFMTGYRLVFNREEMLLGWSPSNCYDAVQNHTGSNTLPINQQNSTEAPSPSSVVPEATSGKGNGTPASNTIPPLPTARSLAPSLNSFTSEFLIFVVSLLGYYHVILSS